ncbi:MAG: HNH endonuclease signature motif containing protein [Bythopirellula sp.]|nr:HNH endonuclease signature motif containing protein [Bythopirellula sp.]
MSSSIPRPLAREVRERADDCCEYCLLRQDSQEATFHVDHIVPRSRGGPTTLDNLALACVSCSLHKAARQSARDPRTGKRVPLYNPRFDDWNDHFAFTKRWRISGRSPVGRATIEALDMNRAAIVAIRIELVQLGRYPPDVE